MAPVSFRPMRPGEITDVLDLLEEAFGARFLFEGYCRHDPAFSPGDFLLALEGGRPVSCVQIFTKEIRLRGERVSMGGIGSVATAPTRRKRGLATELLRRSIEEMRARGMALSLLYSTLSLYESLGWVRIPQGRIAFHRASRSMPLRPHTRPRRFRPTDRAEVERLYESYSSGLESPTLRDGAYWDGQLLYAGSPEEDFRVAEREGRAVAYARRVQLYGVPLAMEYARGADAAADLADLLWTLAPDDVALILPWCRDEALLEALRARADRLDELADRSLMWRVIDRARLESIAHPPPGTTDSALLEALVSGPPALYWPSDRF